MGGELSREKKDERRDKHLRKLGLWVEHLTNTLFKGPTEAPYPPGAPVAARAGSKPADGSPAIDVRQDL